MNVLYYKKKLVGFVRETLWYFKSQLDRKAVNKMLVLAHLKDMLCRIKNGQKIYKQKVCLHKKER